MNLPNFQDPPSENNKQFMVTLQAKIRQSESIILKALEAHGEQKISTNLPNLVPKEDSEKKEGKVLGEEGSSSGKPSSSLMKSNSTSFKLGISFNGGKDSVVMLELLMDVLGLRYVQEHMFLFMFEEQNEFAELVAYREEYLSGFGLPLEVVPTRLGFRDGLAYLVDKYGVQGVFLGTRQDDPDGRWQDSPIAPCSPGWPNVIRYCPVFFWDYNGVWQFLRERQVKICSLYELGYTSLGSKSTTVRNPELCLNDGGIRFLPAWELKNGDMERKGRIPKERL